MTPAEAKAKWDAAVEAAQEKQRNYFYAKLTARKLEQAYLTALEEKPDLDAKTSQKMCGDWYEAERKAENARFEARQADAAQEKASVAFQQAVAETGG